MPPKKEMNLRPQLVPDWNIITTFDGWTFFEHVPEDIKKITRAFYLHPFVNYIITTDRRVIAFMPDGEKEWPHAEITGLDDRPVIDIDPRFTDSGIALKSNGSAVIFSYLKHNKRPAAIRANGLVAIAGNQHNRLVVNRSGNVTAFSSDSADGEDEKSKITLDRKGVRAVACSGDWSLVKSEENLVTRWYKSANGAELLDVDVDDGKFKQWATSGYRSVLLLSESGNVFSFANDDKGDIWQLFLPEPIDRVVATGAEMYAARGEHSNVYYVWGGFKAHKDDKVLKMDKKWISGQAKPDVSEESVDYVKTSLQTLPDLIVQYAARQDTPHVMWVAQDEDDEEEDDEPVPVKPKTKAAKGKKKKKAVAAKGKAKAAKKVEPEAEFEDDDDSGEDYVPRDPKRAMPRQIADWVSKSKTNKRIKMSPNEEDEEEEPMPDVNVEADPKQKVTKKTTKAEKDAPSTSKSNAAEPEGNKKRVKNAAKAKEEDVAQPEAAPKETKVVGRTRGKKEKDLSEEIEQEAEPPVQVDDNKAVERKANKKEMIVAEVVEQEIVQQDTAPKATGRLLRNKDNNVEMEPEVIQPEVAPKENKAVGRKRGKKGKVLAEEKKPLMEIDNDANKAVGSKGSQEVDDVAEEMEQEKVVQPDQVSKPSKAVGRKGSKKEMKEVVEEIEQEVAELDEGPSNIVIRKRNKTMDDVAAEEQQPEIVQPEAEVKVVGKAAGRKGNKRKNEVIEEMKPEIVHSEAAAPKAASKAVGRKGKKKEVKEVVEEMEPEEDDAVDPKEVAQEQQPEDVPPEEEEQVVVQVKSKPVARKGKTKKVVDAHLVAGPSSQTDGGEAVDNVAPEVKVVKDNKKKPKKQVVDDVHLVAGPSSQTDGGEAADNVAPEVKAVKDNNKKKPKKQVVEDVVDQQPPETEQVEPAVPVSSQPKKRKAARDTSADRQYNTRARRGNVAN